MRRIVGSDPDPDRTAVEAGLIDDRKAFELETPVATMPPGFTVIEPVAGVPPLNTSAPALTVVPPV